jgi:hypothetical protein
VPFRDDDDDEYGTTLPQECRRSGLNDGTMRKCRAEDIDELRSLPSLAAMTSDGATSCSRREEER